jgi:hypothetical protein
MFDLLLHQAILYILNNGSELRPDGNVFLTNIPEACSRLRNISNGKIPLQRLIVKAEYYDGHVECLIPLMVFGKQGDRPLVDRLGSTSGRSVGARRGALFECSDFHKSKK